MICLKGISTAQGTLANVPQGVQVAKFISHRSRSAVFLIHRRIGPPPGSSVEELRQASLGKKAKAITRGV